MHVCPLLFADQQISVIISVYCFLLFDKSKDLNWPYPLVRLYNGIRLKQKEKSQNVRHLQAIATLGFDPCIY
jgi:hypothetical protein